MRFLIAVLVVCITGFAGAGEKKDSDNFRLAFKYPETLAKKTCGDISIKIIPTNGFKMNEKAPLKISFDYPKDSLNLGSDKLKKGDAIDPAAKEPEFKNTITALKAGEHELKVSLNFVICTPTACQPKRLKKIVKIKVTDKIEK